MTEKVVETIKAILRRKILFHSSCYKKTEGMSKQISEEL